MDVTQAWAGYITKVDKTPEGHRMVYGKATGPDLDLDGQVADPKWLRKAMPEWMAWGNVREMHRPSAAGVGKELSASGDDWNLKALIVDPVAIAKVDAQVYKGFSIGIAKPRTIDDASAPGGRIVGGTIVEVSLVDRPCNPTATMGIAKAFGAALAPVEWAGEVVGKADVDTPGEPVIEVDPAGDPGRAEDPENWEDDGASDDTSDDAAEMLADAAKAAAREQDPPIFAEMARPGTRGIVSAPDAGPGVLPPSMWRKAVVTVEGVLAGTIVKRKADESADIAGAQTVIAQLADLIISEATELKAGRCEELDDIDTLLRACNAVRAFLWREQRQDGQDFPEPASPDTGPSMAYVGLAAEPDQAKRAFSQAQRDDAEDSGAAMPGGRYPILNRDDLRNAIHAVGRGKGDHAEIRAHIVKRARALGLSAMIPDDWSAKAAGPDGATAAVGPDITKMVDDAVAKATNADKERIKALEVDLAKVLAMPRPGGPFIMPAAALPATTAPADDRARRAANFAAQARAATNPDVAHAYRSAAQALAHE